jgi:hypothetical protein
VADWSTRDFAIGVWPGLETGVCWTRTSDSQPERLLSLFARTRELTLQMVEAHGVPLVVYMEQAIGQPNPWLLRADGVVQAAMWSVLQGRSPHPVSIFPLRTTEWRRALGLGPPPKGLTKPEARFWRKDQQRAFALEAGAAEGLSEAEYDAVCVAVAGARDCKAVAA